MPIRTRTLPCLSFAIGLAAAHLFATPTTEPAAVPPDRKPLPEGPGLSARYPGDAGIAGDPAVIYATGFENGIEAPLRPRRKGVSVVQDPALARGGKAAARIVATRGQNEGGDLRIQWEEGVEQAFVRVYVRFDARTVMPHHFVNLGGNTPTYAYRWGGSAGLRPPGDENGSFGTTLEPPKKSDGYWQFYSYWHEMRSWQTPEGKPDGRPSPYYGNNFGYPRQTPKLERDTWICLEYMIKLNTIGQHDGELAFWIDGVNYGHWRPGSPMGRWLRENFYTRGPYFEKFRDPVPFEGFSWRTHPSLKINRATLQWYLSERSYARSADVDEHIVHFDNLVIAKEYIGPIAQPRPKAGGRRAGGRIGTSLPNMSGGDEVNPSLPASLSLTPDLPLPTHPLSAGKEDRCASATNRKRHDPRLDTLLH